jgi:signal transduction histidine kinase
MLVAVSQPHRLRRRFTPLHWIGIAGACALMVTALAVLFATRQPWLGLDLRATANDTEPPRIQAARGPAANVPTGIALQRLSGGGGVIDLLGSDLAPEPDTRFVDFDDYRGFLQRQSALASIVASDIVVLTDATGRNWTLQPAAQRPLQSLPATFWLQLFVGCAGLLVGASVWAFRRDDAAAGYVGITGIGLLLSAVAAGIYSTRELALDAPLFRLLHLANGGGALLFCAAFAATLWHYPARLGSAPVGRSLLAAYGVVFALTATGWLPDFDLALRLPILAGFALTAVFAVLQWRRSRHQPAQRAALKWFLLAWFGGSGAFLAVIFVPPLLGIDSGGAQAYAFALFLAVYAGLALGVLRYRLFDLDRWWFTAWTLMAGAALFVALDLAMIQFTRLGGEDALLLSLLIVTWLYLPLRHWLWQRLAPPRGDAEAALHALVRSSGSGPSRQWPMALQHLFEPLLLRTVDEAPVAAAQLIDEGAAMLVPGVGGSPPLRLEHAQRGRHLFTPQDLRTADALHDILQRLAAERQAVDDGVQQERERVARALHDDVGARLLSLLHESDGAVREQARRALDELRLVMHGLAAHQRPLDDLLGWCRGDLHEWADQHGIALRWQSPDALPAATLDPHHTLLLLRSLRELIAQSVLRTAEQTVAVELMVDRDRLMVRAALDLPGEAEIALDTLRQRADVLGVTLRTGATGDSMSLELPLLHLD